MYLQLPNTKRSRNRRKSVRLHAKKKAKNRRRINRMHKRSLGRRI